MSLKTDLEKLSELIRRELVQELDDHGHIMTGRLARSIRVDVKFLGLSEVSLIGSFLKYGEAVETGVKASRIPFTLGSGKTSSKYITGLMRFIRLRRIAQKTKEVKSIAFVIAKTHKREGMPTRGSRRFSKNSKRRGFVTFTLKRLEDKIETEVSNIFNRDLTVSIDNIVLKNLK